MYFVKTKTIGSSQLNVFINMHIYVSKQNNQTIFALTVKSILGWRQERVASELDPPNHFLTILEMFRFRVFGKKLDKETQNTQSF